MAKRQTITCDGCEKVIPPEHVHIQIEWRYHPKASPYDERAIDNELRALFREPRDFCDLLCVQRWIESLGPDPLP